MFLLRVYFWLKEHLSHPSEIEEGMMIVDEGINVVLESANPILTYDESIYAYKDGHRLIR